MDVGENTTNHVANHSSAVISKQDQIDWKTSKLTNESV